MKTFLFALGAALTLAACQSSPSSPPKVPANLAPEETAPPRADTAHTLPR